MTAPDYAAILRHACDAIIASADELSRYDMAIGDGDHGASMAKAFTAVRGSLADGGLSSILTGAGEVLLEAVGGAMGPLFGTAFLAAGAVVTVDGPMDAGTVASCLEAAESAVIRLGGAAPGDKTLLDALHPAGLAAREVAAGGGAACDALAAAATAARHGAEATAGMLARRGRASRLGERSVGHLDPGAVSTAILLEALSRAATLQYDAAPR